ncbi:hypothetical protein RUM43_008716 [Polyplax serrata]|uniref:Uncharacterized protein n=1 Tax=Polyplax serrata TaxID=468196 RepID=A0AAN8S415_POLSC
MGPTGDRERAQRGGRHQEKTRGSITVDTAGENDKNPPSRRRACWTDDILDKFEENVMAAGATSVSGR